MSVFLFLPKFGNIRSRVFHTKKEVHSQATNVTASPITINKAVERMITAVNIVTGDDGHRSQEAVKTFIELLKMEEKDYAKQQQFYG